MGDFNVEQRDSMILALLVVLLAVADSRRTSGHRGYASRGRSSAQVWRSAGVQMAPRFHPGGYRSLKHRMPSYNEEQFAEGPVDGGCPRMGTRTVRSTAAIPC